MRIATLQFAPRLGDVVGNIKKADEVLKSGKTIAVDGEEHEISLLVLPELAFTGTAIYSSHKSESEMADMFSAGYNFPSLEAIQPYLEPVGKGPSASWARATAMRLQCKVCVGYPEIEKENPETEEVKCYNSLFVVDENGDMILNYRKSFLYFTDETWATEGSVEQGFHELSFKSRDKPQEKRVFTSFGICMDINPYKFEAPFTAWEFAHRVLDSKSQLVILSMAWLTMLSAEELDALQGQAEMDTFNYWLQRFWPLIQKKMTHEADLDHDTATDIPKKVVIVFANRAGEEPPVDDDKPPARYAGTSAIIAITQRPVESRDDEPGGEEDAFEVNILCWDMMGAAEEGICFADTTAGPKMVFGLKKASDPC